ncbi:hypothetical protein F0562_004410 [Nyssa sinensis]|uniref:F-box associated domain-containing protein n=1 Tax=Nyssa sinensis TaxID=561372 RepID=A0A5J5C339_9ASTE|nr:hypothetical protein F0562_004410 [Nyssa sinensis]
MAVFCLFNGINSVALWNPATREFKALPRLPRLDPDLQPEKLIKSLNVFGFGLDSLTNDFKVVWMRTLENIYTDTETEDDDDEDEYNQLCHSVRKAIYVYSLKVDSWRELKDPDDSTIPVSFDEQGRLAQSIAQGAAARQIAQLSAEVNLLRSSVQERDSLKGELENLKASVAK